MSNPSYDCENWWVNGRRSFAHTSFWRKGGDQSDGAIHRVDAKPGGWCVFFRYGGKLLERDVTFKEALELLDPEMHPAAHEAHAEIEAYCMKQANRWVGRRLRFRAERQAVETKGEK